MPSKYCLLLDATIANSSFGDGDFDSQTDPQDKNKSCVGIWVKDGDASTKQGDSTALKVDAGDSISFAVRINGSSAGNGTSSLNWFAVTVNDKTDKPNVKDSPFQLSNGGVWPLMIANRSAAGGAMAFSYYDTNGAGLQSPIGGSYYGIGPLEVKDAGSFEVVIAVELVGTVDGTSIWCQLSHDPEIDTKKGGS
jgi:hypothetical protein